MLGPDGFPLWVSQAEPGSVHDMTAARIHALPALYHAAAHGLPALADPGYDGAGIGIHTPVRQPADGRDLDGVRVASRKLWSDIAQAVMCVRRAGGLLPLCIG